MVSTLKDGVQAGSTFGGSLLPRQISSPPQTALRADLWRWFSNKDIDFCSFFSTRMYNVCKINRVHIFSITCYFHCITWIHRILFLYILRYALNQIRVYCILLYCEKKPDCIEEPMRDPFPSIRTQHAIPIRLSIMPVLKRRILITHPPFSRSLDQ